VCVCVCVWLWACIARWSGHWPSNRKVVGSIPSCGHFGVVGVSLSKKFYSHCASPPSCINGDLGSSPPCCNISGYLVITGEANVKLPANGCGPGGTCAWFSPTCGALALPRVDLPAAEHGLIVPDSCPGQAPRCFTGSASLGWRSS